MVIIRLLYDPDNIPAVLSSPRLAGPPKLRRKFHTLDVFTDTPFAGNPLAVADNKITGLTLAANEPLRLRIVLLHPARVALRATTL